MARFDLNLLSALDVLLEERNVTKAADRLHVTQPTMSGMLQRLRYQFDDQLLIRIGRSMELTPFASSLVKPVREALIGIDALVHTEPCFDPATSTREFRIMASDYCAQIFLPHVIGHLARTAPGIRLSIRTMNAPADLLSSGEIDLCISTDDRSLLFKEAAEDKLQSEHLFTDQFVCIVAEDHALTDTATLEEYLAFPHVGVQMVGIPNTIEAASLRRHAPGYRPTYTVPDFSAVACVVAHSRVVGMVQRRLAVLAARSYPIRHFLPPMPMPPINETMLWHPRHTGDPAQAWLRCELARAAAVWLSEVREPRLRLAGEAPAGPHRKATR